MDPKIINFLSRHKILALATQLPDGTLHSAVCHYAHSDNPLELIIYTEDTTRKCSGMQDSKGVNASLAIGFSEEEWVELQMSGTVRMVKQGAGFDRAKTLFEAKFRAQLHPDPEDVFVIFTPTWWRYTEFKRDPVIKLGS